MNGASADPCANTSSAPRVSITSRIGSSQNFLRARMKPHNSPTSPRCATRVSGELVRAPLAVRHLCDDDEEAAFLDLTAPGGHAHFHKRAFECAAWCFVLEQ